MSESVTHCSSVVWAVDSHCSSVVWAVDSHCSSVVWAVDSHWVFNMFSRALLLSTKCASGFILFTLDLRGWVWH